MTGILYEDNAIIVVRKPAGVDAQASRGFGADMVSMLQNYLADCERRAGRSENGVPYIAVVHRLDKPVSGVMVYAKNRPAAAALSKQLREAAMSKVYYALVCGKPSLPEGLYEDRLIQDKRQNRSYIAAAGSPEEAQAKPARLRYRVVEKTEPEYHAVLQALGWERAAEADKTLVRIELLTGRHHQIRVQMAGHGTPLVGDTRYHPQGGRSSCGLTLCAWSLAFCHPDDHRNMYFEYSSLPQS